MKLISAERLPRGHPTRERRCSGQRGSGKGYDYHHGESVIYATWESANGRIVHDALCEGCGTRLLAAPPEAQPHEGAHDFGVGSTDD